MARKKVTRHLHRKLVWLTILLHVVLLAVFFLDGQAPPDVDNPMALLWANERQWQFYLLFGVLIGSLTATIWAWRKRGWHRLTLLSSWVIFVGMLVEIFSHRMSVMLQLAWRHG